MNAQNVVELRGLSKTYRGSGVAAVNDLSLTVAAGEIMGFLGPNGAGKTTTLSIICGLLATDRGTVTVLGHDVRRNPAPIRPLIGLVPQEIALYPSLTARENLAFFGRMHGLGGQELARRLAECLAMVALQEAADRRVSTFSGGMKRRCNLAAGLLHRPPLLVLDEPTVGVDVQSRSLIFESLNRLNAAGTTMLYATHDMEAAHRLCHRVAVIDGGRVLAVGSPDALLARHPGSRNLEELFLELTGHGLRD